tara:strand:- start:639 stop:1490 length:852 start_codon:yes stop_codon:yes gene_type:complete
MPIPKPSYGESREGFLSRCMSDETMNSEYPKRDQRMAVCISKIGGKMSEESSKTTQEQNLEDEIKHQFIEFDLKAYGDDDDEEEKGKFSGYGSIFGNKDLGNDVVVTGAFSKSLKRREPREIKMLWQHKQDMPIGVFTSIKEDGDGLAVQGQLALGTQRGKEAYELLKIGALDGLSIGYKADPNKQDYDSRRRRRMLKEVDLMEISLVTFPMNPKARVSAVKAEDRTIREWERFLREEATLSHSQSKACAKAIMDTITKQRDVGDGEIVSDLQKLASIIKPTL